jgi:hypothetical protein
VFYVVGIAFCLLVIVIADYIYALFLLYFTQSVVSEKYLEIRLFKFLILFRTPLESISGFGSSRDLKRLRKIWYAADTFAKWRNYGVVFYKKRFFDLSFLPSQEWQQLIYSGNGFTTLSKLKDLYPEKFIVLESSD